MSTSVCVLGVSCKESMKVYTPTVDNRVLGVRVVGAAQVRGKR